MKRILILLGLVAVVQFSVGSNSIVGSLPVKRNGSNEARSEMFAPIFKELDGNLFIALKTKEIIKVEDGDIVEFEFSKGRKIRSFHINDINQDLIDSKEADLFIMVHHVLALELKVSRIEKIHIRHGDSFQSIEVNRFWIPDEYLGSL